MIVVIGGIKGGSGKTTIATNLAIMRALAGTDVLLVDADDQETASDFSTWRDMVDDASVKYTCIKLSGKAVRTEVLKQVDKYTDIIIDTGGRDTSSQRAALTIAHYLLVPFVPRSFDLWTLSAVSDLVKDIRIVNPDLKVFSFLNRADPRGSDNDDAIAYIRDTKDLEFIDISIGQRKTFGKAAADGKSIMECKPVDTKAVEELQTLYNKLYT